MQQRMTDFLSTVGVTVLGVGLVFLGSVTVTGKKINTFVNDQLPVVPMREVVEGGDSIPAVLPVSRPRVPVLKNKDTQFGGVLTAAVAIVVDDQSNTILYKKNPEEIRSLASITKLMSALVLTDLPINWSSSTIVSDEDADPSSHHIDVGERYTFENLWKIALVGSSNSAIRTLVRSAGFTDEQFADLMNRKAEALGLNSLRFVEPTGLDSRNMGSAADILRLLKAALKVDHIAEALHTSEYFAEPLNKKTKHQVWSTNWLLTNWVPNTFDKDVLVGKTGFIDQSGYNFVVRVPGPKSHVVRVVVLGAATNEARFSEARDLAKWVFDNYAWPDDEGYDAVSL
jgi:D-alanyl-D-alanine endopeptidase (penicillin-binding protein 7)